MRSAPPRPERLRALVEREAKALGFDVVGIVSAEGAPAAAARLAQFLQLGRHGSMSWMMDTATRRGHPKTLWPQVRSIIMLGMNYGPVGSPLTAHDRRGRGAISVYARNRDYHDVIKGRLKQIAGKFASRAKAEVKVFVDTAPVMEKPLAEAAGLGWQGKHTNLVSRQFGSWLFLGSIFTTAELLPDKAEQDHCGSCRACLDICPTDAFPAPYQIDARRCISYLTIENKGPIPHEFRVKIGNRIYGCDDCLAVCPWNKFAKEASEAKLKAREDLNAPLLAQLLEFDDQTFRTFFSGSPIKRIGRDRFIRNVLIAAGNSGDGTLVYVCERLAQDASPLVRGAAIWALSRLMLNDAFHALASRLLPAENDAEVRLEWEHALAGAAA